MRVVWLLGANPRVQQELQTLLNSPLYGQVYLVRRAESLLNIPEEHYKDPGVTLLLDAFSPFHPGFEGLKAAREKNFKGKIFLCGEPGSQMAGQAILHHNLNGYFGSFDRVDLHFLAGVIHNSIYFDGQMNLMQFLKPGGRCASDQIKSLKDFNIFGNRLGAFVGRFGVDLNHLRKVLMGLSLGHVKSGTPGTQMDDTFVIHYGMDPQKIVLVTTTLSKGANESLLHQEFSELVTELKSSAPPKNASMFPEMHHVARSSENMVLLCGSSKYQHMALDPMMIFTVLPFPGPKNQKHAYYQFAFSHVSYTEEMEESVARLDPAPEAHAELEAQQQTEDETHSQPDVTTLKETELNAILSEPKITGDQPVINNATPKKPVFSSAQRKPLPYQEQPSNDKSNMGGVMESVSDDDSTNISNSKYQQALDEIENLKVLCAALGEDVKRLMKERRVPSGDKELKESFMKLEAKHKELTTKYVALTEELKEKEAEIKNMKTPEGKKNKAA